MCLINIDQKGYFYTKYLLFTSDIMNSNILFSCNWLHHMDHANILSNDLYCIFILLAV